VLTEIIALFEEFHVRHLDIKRLNFAYLVFILKKEGANLVHKIRAISLLNVIYKVIRKVLTNRLNTKLQLLVDPAQTGFTKG